MFALSSVWTRAMSAYQTIHTLSCIEHFWVCITFCKVWHGDSVTKPDYSYVLVWTGKMTEYLNKPRLAEECKRLSLFMHFMFKKIIYRPLRYRPWLLVHRMTILYEIWRNEKICVEFLLVNVLGIFDPKHWRSRKRESFFSWPIQTQNLPSNGRVDRLFLINVQYIHHILLIRCLRNI